MESYQNQSSVLTESGTNEVELMEFQIGPQHFGINVAKVRSIISYDPACVTELKTAERPAFIGTYLLRGKTIALVDLALAIGRKLTTNNKRRLVMITEFNGAVHALLVDAVTQIHRISWKDISPNPELIADLTSVITGSVNIDKHEVLLLDVEFILSSIFPHLGIKNEAIPTNANVPTVKTRQQMRIVIAEDSSTIRTLITKVLHDSGYTQIQSFIDGEDAYTHIKALQEKAKQNGKNLTDEMDLLITDIEMPRMDGLTVCRKIRTELNEKKLTIIIFSSLINEAMAAKCRSVGADNFISKPQIQGLVEILDTYLNPKKA